MSDDPLDRARELRRNMTDAERQIWTLLRDRRFAKHKFRRQVPLDRFIVDFVCFSSRLIVEIDGRHHAEQVEYDERRTRRLEELGFRVIRFKNKDVLDHWDRIEAELKAILSG